MSTDNLRKLTANLGRASTPTVPSSSFGITNLSVIGKAATAPEKNSALVVGGRELLSQWPQYLPYRAAVPGLAQEQAEDENFSAMVIEVSAFSEGLWLGADSGSYLTMSEEIFEAGRKFRATGRSVILLNSGSHTLGTAFPRIESTSTINLSEVPPEDLEEGAAQSSLWNFLVSFLSHAAE